MRPGARFRRAIQLTLAATPVALAVGLRFPRLALASVALAPPVAAAAARARGARTADAAVLGALAVPFGACYLAGMWRGALLRARHRIRPAVVDLGVRPR
jgi:hypothetical protein